MHIRMCTYISMYFIIKLHVTKNAISKPTDLLEGALTPLAGHFQATQCNNFTFIQHQTHSFCILHTANKCSKICHKRYRWNYNIILFSFMWNPVRLLSSCVCMHACYFYSTLSLLLPHVVVSFTVLAFVAQLRKQFVSPVLLTYIGRLYIHIYVCTYGAGIGWGVFFGVDGILSGAYWR